MSPQHSGESEWDLMGFACLEAPPYSNGVKGSPWRGVPAAWRAPSGEGGETARP